MGTEPTTRPVTSPPYRTTGVLNRHTTDLIRAAGGCGLYPPATRHLAPKAETIARGSTGAHPGHGGLTGAAA